MITDTNRKCNLHMKVCKNFQKNCILSNRAVFKKKLVDVCDLRSNLSFELVKQKEQPKQYVFIPSDQMYKLPTIS